MKDGIANELEKIKRLLYMITQEMPTGPATVLVEFGLRIVARSLEEVASTCLLAKRHEHSQQNKDEAPRN